MEKIRRKKAEGQGSSAGQVLLPVLGVLVTVRKALYDLVVGSGLAVLQALLESEREQLCGERYKHDAGRTAVRGGHAVGELVLGGRRVEVKRPRVHGKDGKELKLPSWEKFAREDPLEQRAVEQMLVGVATRQYARSLEPMPAEVKTRGTSKSAVSRRFVAATEARLSEWLTRSLEPLKLAALMLDGIVCGEHTVLVALGIDESGVKHVLGLWEGATENGAACTALLSNLVERGLPTDRTILVVIDGGKGMAKAVRAVFGKRAMIQRCQVHKRRNVLDQLPERLHASIGAALASAYRTRDYDRAVRLLNNLARRLNHECPGAAASLREGLEETLTILQFKLIDALERTLATTNPIENLNGLIRNRTRNVRRWESGTMVLRWVAAAMDDAAKGFRRLKGHAGMPKLVAALRARDARLDGTVAAEKKAA